MFPAKATHPAKNNSFPSNELRHRIGGDSYNYREFRSTGTPPSPSAEHDCGCASSEADLSTREGFERFILDYQKDVFRFLLRRGVPVQAAPDLRQDAFLVLWKDRDKPRDPRAFLLGVANRLATAYHRKSLQLPTVSLEETHADAPAADIEEAPDAEPQDLPPELAFALSALTPRQREVIDLVWLQDLSRGEAAERLGITQGTLRAREKRAFDALGKKISRS